jgi:hypothetical protein
MGHSRAPVAPRVEAVGAAHPVPDRNGSPQTAAVEIAARTERW